MFRRVTLEGWQEFVPYLCFALIAGAFLLIVIRAVRMKKSEVDRLSRLPLQDEPPLEGDTGEDHPSVEQDSKKPAEDDRD